MTDTPDHPHILTDEQTGQRYEVNTISDSPYEQGVKIINATPVTTAPVRWRPGSIGETYYTVLSDLSTMKSMYTGHKDEQKTYIVGNQFQTRQQAEAAATAIRATLAAIHDHHLTTDVANDVMDKVQDAHTAIYGDAA